MSNKVINWVLALSEIKSPGAKFVLMVLANYANDAGECYPSRETLAGKTGFSIRTVQTHIDWLDKNGYISRSKRRTANQQFSSNFYVLRPGADFGEGTRRQVQISTEPSAVNDKNQVQNLHTIHQGETMEENQRGNRLPRSVYDKILDDWMTAIENVFDSPHLPKRHRWETGCQKAIESNIDKQTYISALSYLLRKTDPKYPVTPDNVLAKVLQDRASRPKLQDFPSPDERVRKYEEYRQRRFGIDEVEHEM